MNYVVVLGFGISSEILVKHLLTSQQLFKMMIISKLMSSFKKHTDLAFK